MSMYDLDSKNNNSSNFSAKSSKQKSSALTWLWIILGIFVGFGLGLVSSGQMSSLVQNLENPLSQLSHFINNSPTNSSASSTAQAASYVPQNTQEEAVINAVKTYSPAVVSIIITKISLSMSSTIFTIPILGVFGILKYPEYAKKEPNRKR